MNKPDYKLWAIFARFMEELADYAAKQHIEAIAELKKTHAEFKEKIEEANRLNEEEAAAKKKASATEKIQQGTFIIGTTAYEKLYSELADAVKDLLHVACVKGGEPVSMMEPLSRLSRLVEGEKEK